MLKNVDIAGTKLRRYNNKSSYKGIYVVPGSNLKLKELYWFLDFFFSIYALYHYDKIIYKFATIIRVYMYRQYNNKYSTNSL